ncbi:uncharacterized protein LOC142621123 isoform X2 [Castanea sativa]|uniref:uncharacterized protein LOC142621123 isoform X2 n=1 Tax=Castanea sativa TaxID=21020 RepID=UPI003F64EA5B
MDKSDDKDEPLTELSPGDIRPPPEDLRRCVRRRLVQSTLFPQKPQECEENGDHKVQNTEKDCAEDEDEDEDEDENFGGSSQSKKKRKPKGKSMLRASKKVKEKRAVNTTPKKTMANSIECQAASPPVPDLRLEAKMSAQDEAASLDWRNWKFCDGTFINTNHSLENTSSSIFESSAGSLHIDKLPIFLHPCDASTVQNEASLDQCPNQLEHAPEVDYEVEEVGLFSGHASCLRKSDILQQSRFLQESMMSYYASPDNQLENCLWTYKYKPKKATEVCGNDESVKFLSDWLHMWHERGFQISKVRTDGDQCDMQDDDYRCSDSEDIDEEPGLKNVLLVTGPVGCGKSAAIYACAQEQGFEILELSASDCRSGALVKQRFGEALESRWLKRSLGHPVESQNNHIVKSPQSLPNCSASQEFENEVVEVIPSDEEAPRDGIGASAKFVCKENGTVHNQSEVKPLILFEDVDITFLEDRGFLAAIQQIAETAKGPMILTSNSNNPVLPDSLDRLQACFTLPSLKELLCHICMVCAAEGANVQPHLLERLVGSCDGDIRKIIMHLQFWCQGRRFRKDRKEERTYGSLVFDIDAGHQLLPKIIPWEFPSQLSELIEKEITNSLSMMEEISTSMEVVEEELDKKEMQKGLDTHDNETESIEAKKVAMLNRNGSVEDCIEFTAQFDELSNSSGPPVAFSRRNVRRKLDAVLSSDSEDEILSNGYPIVFDKDSNNEPSQGVNNSFPFSCPLTENCLSPLTNKLLSGAENLEETCYQHSERPDMQIDETCKSFDVSCVPESSFVPETMIGDVTELLSRSGHVADSLEVSVSNEWIQTLFPDEAENCDKPLLRLQKHSDMLRNKCDVNPEILHGEEVEDSQTESVEATRGYQVMDECSRMDFNRRSKFVDKPRLLMVTDLVQESWIKLRGCRTDLRQYIVLERQDAIQSIKLAHGMSNLISEADLLLSNCQMVASDSLEPSLDPSEGSDAFSWCDEQIQMTSTIAQHGFCFYAKDIAAVGSKMGCESSVDIASEMLGSTTHTMALGKLIGQEMRTSSTLFGASSEMSSPKSDLSRSEINSSLFDIIQSMIPARSYLMVRDVALYEYISSLCHISRSETSRLSGGTHKNKRRRGRAARHYLSTGSLMLSPEDILLLDQYNLYGSFSSQLVDASLR